MVGCERGRTVVELLRQFLVVAMSLSENIRVSIIIPVYNVGRFLSHCLDSVLLQTFVDFECICIDDGSTDGSGVLLDDYAGKDERIIVVHAVNSGVAAARNRGLDIAKGEFVVFLDADDALTPRFLESGVAVMDSDSDIGAWIAQRYYVDASYNVMQRQPMRLKSGVIKSPLREFLLDYSRFYYFCVWGRFLRGLPSKRIILDLA